MLAFAAHPSRRRFAPPQDEGGEVRDEGSGRRSSAKAKNRGVPDGVTAQVSESICRSSELGRYPQCWDALVRSTVLVFPAFSCRPPTSGKSQSFSTPTPHPSRRRFAPPQHEVEGRGAREDRGRWSSGGGGGRRGVGPTTGCIHMRMRSAFGSNSGSLMMVALRRSPRISISKAPSCVFDAKSEGIYPCARDFRR